ncbi:hypothetical protein ACWD6S_36980, partial [Streptomyces zhihengii]
MLQELLHYLQHENSGCHGFQNMGPAWVPVRKGIDDETLCRSVARPGRTTGCTCTTPVGIGWTKSRPRHDD